jgi:DNA repair photolyase
VVSRFDSLQIEPPPADLHDTEWWAQEDDTVLRTKFFKDSARTILSENNSPDIGFRYSLNCYKGCEHGCAYCYARPTHEYLGLSAGVDFETKIFVKEDAPKLLREKFMSKSWQPEVVMMSGNTDCYQPAEARFQLTRKCLQVFAEFKNPVSLITKNALIVRDLDIFTELSTNNLVHACLSITSLDQDLQRVLEPRTSVPKARLQAVETLAKAGIPVSVNIAPIIPGLNDHEVPAIMKAAKDHGAESIGYTPLRLPYSVSQIFTEWLEKNRPLAKEKVLHLIRDIRGGKLNDANFVSRMQGQGAHAENIKKMVRLFREKYGLNERDFSFRTDLFCRPGDQLSLL